MKKLTSFSVISLGECIYPSDSMLYFQRARPTLVRGVDHDGCIVCVDNTRYNLRVD